MEILMPKIWLCLLTVHLLLHTHILEQKKHSIDQYVMPHILNFEQLSAPANNVSFKKPTSIADFGKIISSYNFTGYQNACTYKNLALKHTINLKKKRLTYTLACKY